MARLPRLAIGSLDRATDATFLTWGLLAALSGRGQRVQSFLSQARFVPRDGATVVTGHSPRHLDTWLMSPEACRSSFLRGTSECDVAIVEGAFSPSVADDEADLPGGRLDRLCQWLELPRVAVLDVASLSPCCLPPRPAAAALLLDRVRDRRALCQWQTHLESLWGIPVLGGLEETPLLRQVALAIPPGDKPSAELCSAFGQSFERLSDVDRIFALADTDFSYRRGAEGTMPDVAGLRIAVAYDDAFHCYFPDTLDLLEARGATLCDFSPLADERLPAGTDIVYLGCGHPERFARELVENHCMTAALREHVCNGARVYAECGGLAYLCDSIELPDGSRLPMAGVLPARARMEAAPAAPRPLEVEWARGSWLAEPRTRWRGYLNARWSLEPSAALSCYVRCAAGGCLVVGRHHVVGSRLHFNFAAHPTALEHFFAPHAPALQLAAVDVPRMS